MVFSLKYMITMLVVLCVCVGDYIIIIYSYHIIISNQLKCVSRFVKLVDEVRCLILDCKTLRYLRGSFDFVVELYIWILK